MVLNFIFSSRYGKATYVASAPVCSPGGLGSNPGPLPSALPLPPAPNSFGSGLGCALTFASEAQFEIEAKISFRLEAKKKA
jgi:hypothetical protein